MKEHYGSSQVPFVEAESAQPHRRSSFLCIHTIHNTHCHLLIFMAFLAHIALSSHSSAWLVFKMSDQTGHSAQQTNHSMLECQGIIPSGNTATMEPDSSTLSSHTASTPQQNHIDPEAPRQLSDRQIDTVPHPSPSHTGNTQHWGPANPDSHGKLPEDNTDKMLFTTLGITNWLDDTASDTPEKKKKKIGKIVSGFTANPLNLRESYLLHIKKQLASIVSIIPLCQWAKGHYTSPPVGRGAVMIISIYPHFLLYTNVNILNLRLNSIAKLAPLRT
jgi:hypothetical protein